MRVPVKWLKELVDVNVTSKELANKFSLMSQEVESVYPLVSATNLKVGYVEECYPHPDSDHLHVTKINVGNEVLNIVCGAPNIEAGQKVIVALEGAVLPGNFKIKKSKIRGVESCGMVCSLDELGIEKKYHNEDGIHVLPDDSIVGSDPLACLNLDTDIIELDLTPNRGELLSMMGVAYDTKALLNTNIHFTKPHYEELKEVNDIKITLDTKLCKAYYARMLTGVKINESPEWLKGILIAAGIRPINNIVDITNYVLMYTGQPLHAFDADKFMKHEVVVREAIDGEKFITLDNVERTLVNGDILITDGVNPTCLGGIMGGLDSEITDTTNHVMIESAIFDNIQIRKTSKRLDLRSESSMRFERGVDPNRTNYALDLAITMMVELADAKVLKGLSYVNSVDLCDKEIELSLTKIKNVTGNEYTKEDIEDVLNRLSFKYETNDENFKVYAPTRRSDINTYQDIIEEIVRINGYERIPLDFPRTINNGYLTSEQLFLRQLRNNLSHNLNEVMTYSLVSNKEALEFDQEEKEVIRVANPIIEERKALRHSLIPSLISVVKYNQLRKLDDIQIFEIGNVYFKGEEKEMVACALSGFASSTLWQGKKEAIDFFYVKGLINELLGKLSINNVEYKVPNKLFTNLHPGVQAEIYANNIYLGFIGKLHPVYENEKEVKNVFVFEFAINSLYRAQQKLSLMNEIPKYPYIVRDLALVAGKTITSQMITDVIKKASKKTLVDLNVFDVYQKSKTSETYSIAYSLTFQDFNKTLESAEVDQMINKILKHLKDELDVTLRQ